MATDPDARAAATPMPPRPVLSDTTPAPHRGATPQTGVIRAMNGLWIASFIFGAVAVLYSFVFRDAQLEQLRLALSDQQPALTEEQLASTSTALFLVSLTAIGVVVILEVVLVRVLLSGRGGARWALAAAVLVQAAVAVAAIAFIALGNERVLTIACVLTSLVSSCAALVAGVLPGARAWFRRERERHRSR